MKAGGEESRPLPRRKGVEELMFGGGNGRFVADTSCSRLTGGPSEEPSLNHFNEEILPLGSQRVTLGAERSGSPRQTARQR